MSDTLVELRDALDIGPRELAKRLSEPESEVSRLLSLQKIDPELRKAVTADDASQFTRRHLPAVAQIPPREQREIVSRARAENLTAVETERVVTTLRREPADKPAARRTSSRRFAIGSAVVEVRFRKRTVTDDEAIDVLERASRLVLDQTGNGTSESSQSAN